VFPLLGLLIMGVGFLNLLAPQVVWRYSEGWKYKHPDAIEPSPAAQTMRRVSGAAMVVVGLWVVSGP
jgi:hypothetical protein